MTIQPWVKCPIRGQCWERGDRRIYKTDDDPTHYQGRGGYVISENEVWIPGVYDAFETAEAAFGYPDRFLQALQDRVRPMTITALDLEIGETRDGTHEQLTEGE